MLTIINILPYSFPEKLQFICCMGHPVCMSYSFQFWFSFFLLLDVPAIFRYLLEILGVIPPVLRSQMQSAIKSYTMIRIGYRLFKEVYIGYVKSILPLQDSDFCQTLVKYE